MSAETSKDVSLINDEDVLRKMWQDTEDFGRKKEIRAHMYKLREARLREFYNSGEVNKEIRKASTITENKSCSTTTHADSLADQSFMTMKSKEIRDSESPTRDVSYRITDKSSGLGGQDWIVVTSNRSSNDGKTHTTTKIATCSSNENTDSDKLSYAAKSEQQAIVYEHGNDQNFTKAIGASTNTVIKQEALGDDENNIFRNSSTRTTSSSKFVSEHHLSGDSGVKSEIEPITDSALISRKNYTSDAPSDFKNHPSYVDRKTKIIRETRTLPNDTVVTTTKYETKGGNIVQSSSCNTSKTQHKSSSINTAHTSSTRPTHDSKINQNDKKTVNNIETCSNIHIVHRDQDEIDRLEKSANRVVEHTTVCFPEDLHQSNKITATTTINTQQRIVDSEDQSVKPLDNPVTTTTKTITTDDCDSQDYPSYTKDNKDISTTTKTTVVRNVSKSTEKPLVSNKIHTDEYHSIREINGSVKSINAHKSTYNNEDKLRKTVADTNINEAFIEVEKQDDKVKATDKQSQGYSKPYEQYQIPEKRHPIKPGKSEFDRKPDHTSRQYETTYRNDYTKKPADYTNKRISVDVSPTHEAFARSLRAVTPDRISKCSSTSRGSLRTSTTSIRSSTSPDKHISPDRNQTYHTSPDRFLHDRSVSPRKITDKSSSTEAITFRSKMKNDIITKANRSTEIDSNTLTRRTKPRSRSPSATSLASDIEYIKHSDLVTDLDTNETVLVTKRNPYSESTHKHRKIFDRSPSPLTDISPSKLHSTNQEISRRNSLRDVKNQSDFQASSRAMNRTDIYEERCREILGINDVKIKHKDSVEKTKKDKTTTVKNSSRSIYSKDTLQNMKSTEKDFLNRAKQVEKTEGISSTNICKFPSQVRKSLEKHSLENETEHRKPIKETSGVCKFPTEIQKSLGKETPEKVLTRQSPHKETPEVSEFPRKIHKSFDKELARPPTEETQQINEFSGQIRRSLERNIQENYSERQSPVKEVPKISVLPSKIKKSSGRESLGTYPEGPRTTEVSPKIIEFPNQIRKSPEKEPLSKIPEKQSLVKEAPKICEFPSQIRRSLEKELLEKYPEQTRSTEGAPRNDEYSSQIRKSPQREYLENYLEGQSSITKATKICELSSQIKTFSQKEPLKKYPEQTRPTEEVPSQIRKWPERKPFKKYPEKQILIKEAPRICEFPFQISRSPEKEPLKKYTRQTEEGPKINEFPSQIRKTPQREPSKKYTKEQSPVMETPNKMCEFPSQIRRSPEKESLEKNLKRTRPTQVAPKINEFPSQIRKSLQREPSEKYHDKQSPITETTKICEFPSQIRSSENESLKKYPGQAEEIHKDDKFSNKIRKSPQREPLEKCPLIQIRIKEAPKICEYSSQIRTSPAKEPLEKYSERTKTAKESHKSNESSNQIRKLPERQSLRKSPERQHPVKEGPKRTLEKEPLHKKVPTNQAPEVYEFSSQVEISPETEPSPMNFEGKGPVKNASQVIEFLSQEKNRSKNLQQKESSQKLQRTLHETDTLDRTTVNISDTSLQEPKYKDGKNKEDKPIQKPTSSSESELENEEIVTEEFITINKATDLKNIIPVDEPLATKRFISQLCKDEIRSSHTKEKNIQNLIEQDGTQIQTNKQHKTVKKDLSRTQNKEFLENERTEMNKYKKSQDLKTSPSTKKPLIDKNVIKTNGKSRNQDISINKSVVTNIKNAFEVKSRPKIIGINKSSEKVIIGNIKNLKQMEQNKRTEIKTRKSNETNENEKVTKNATSDSSIKKEAASKTQKSPAVTNIRHQPNKPDILKESVSNQKQESRTSTIKENKLTQEKIPKRHIVTTTITVSSKPVGSCKPIRKPVAPKTSSTTRTTTEVQTTKRLFNHPNLQSDQPLSDTENESFVDDSEFSRRKANKDNHNTQVIQRTSNHINKISQKISTPELASSPTRTSRGKPEKKCITTKSIIINNEINENDVSREVIVDLQRSKSSREPSPDRVCPLPVSSDDDTTPRYPDQIIEPDDGCLRPKSKVIITDSIPENEDLFEINTESTMEMEKTGVKTQHKIKQERSEAKENIESDDCLLNVIQKVNKFITAAEQLTTPQLLSERPKSPKCQYYPEEDVSVSKKVTHFIKTAKNIVEPQQRPSSKPERPNLGEVDESIRNDKCVLSVSDKVSRFGNTAEKLALDSNKHQTDYKIESEKSIFSLKKPLDIRPHTPPNEVTPTKKSYVGYSNRAELQYIKYPPGDSAAKQPYSILKSPNEESKNAISSTTRLRSTESIKKDISLFENTTQEQDIVLKQRDILTRPSVFEERNTYQKDNETNKLNYSTAENKHTETLKSTHLVTNRERSRSNSPDKTEIIYSKASSRERTPDGEVPGYMRPLDRSLRPNSPHRDNINQFKKHTSPRTDEDHESIKTTKFGVTLRRTDSGKATITSKTDTTSVKSRNIVEEHNITEDEVEEIWDLHFLEQLLEKVVGYDLRRKIRTQIRIIKTSISENTLKEASRTLKVRGTSPKKQTKKEIDQSTYQNNEKSQKATEYKTSYSYNEYKSSSTSKFTTRSSQSPEKSPEQKFRTPPKIFQTQLKKTSASSKNEPDDKPEWVTQRNLKKIREGTETRQTSTSTSVNTKGKLRSSPLKQVEPFDIITSGYGVGPTDENGSPLFGLKALRAQNKADTVKVQGSVIRSQYYSENGNEPMGEISVTNYSTDSKHLGKNEKSTNKGITSITTTQKFGTKDTPSLKSLVKNKKEICKEEDEETKVTKSTKTRRGSVKTLSQKFIENAVETSKSERQSSYPKAGLILRTSSFKESKSNSRSREGSPRTENTVTERTSSTKTVEGQSFLTNRSKITSVQDVIDRMKTEDVQDNDFAEDIEARGLLNKFIGSQVILSGIELGNKSSATSESTRRTTKITNTIMEGGKLTAKTRIFQHPIPEEELEAVWDEKVLRLLLEQSTEYEERRRIRARLRQVMAEQEACTELVEKASQEQSGGALEETPYTKKVSSNEPLTDSKVTKVTTVQQTSKKPISPFAKFRQLDKQNSLNTPPSTPKTPSGSGPLFKFTDPALSQSASTIKDRLLHWCRMKTKEYENIQLDNFSTSWADGLAFCALIHHFLPESFDYHALSSKNRRHNFTLAFQVADEKADIFPLLDVDDMVATRKPDWKCVFTYVQAIYRRFKDED